MNFRYRPHTSPNTISYHAVRWIEYPDVDFSKINLIKGARIDTYLVTLVPAVAVKSFFSEILNIIVRLL